MNRRTAITKILFAPFAVVAGAKAVSALPKQEKRWTYIFHGGPSRTIYFTNVHKPMKWELVGVNGWMPEA